MLQQIHLYKMLLILVENKISMHEVGEVVAEKDNVMVGYINRCIVAKYKEFIVLLLSVPIRAY